MSAKARALVRILDRYIWKELSTPFLLGLFVFTFLLLIDRIFDLTDLIINKGVPGPPRRCCCSSTSPPAILVLTIPIGFLLAILVAFGRLSADMEIVALKACGVSPLRLLRPVVIFGLGVAALTGLPDDRLRPQDELRLQVARSSTSCGRRRRVGLKERMFNDTFGNFVIYVDEIAPDQVGAPQRVRVGRAEARGAAVHHRARGPAPLGRGEPPASRSASWTARSTRPTRARSRSIARCASGSTTSRSSWRTPWSSRAARPRATGR